MNKLIGKDVEENSHCILWGITLAFGWRDLRKTTKTRLRFQAGTSEAESTIANHFTKMFGTLVLHLPFGLLVTEFVGIDVTICTFCWQCSANERHQCLKLDVVFIILNLGEYWFLVRHLIPAQERQFMTHLRMGLVERSWSGGLNI
jgi:hypothetical protein